MSKYTAGPVDRAIRVSGRSHSVWLRRHYDTTPDDVWEAWTSRDRLQRWLGEVTGELTEGGTVTLDMGEGERSEITIIRCDAPRRLVVSWSDPNVRRTAAQLTVRPDGAGTLLELEHLGYEDGDLSRSFGAGWEDFLDRLGQELAGAEVTSPSWEVIGATLNPFWKPLADAPAQDDRWPSVVISAGRAVLSAERTYAASPEIVWAAMTDVARLSRWFADVELDDGGEWRAVFTNGAASGTIETCEAGRALVTSWKWDHETSGSVLEVRLEPRGGSTVVRIEQRDAPSDSAAGYGAGWYAMLGVLAIYLDGRKPTETDWDADFALAWRTLNA